MVDPGPVAAPVEGLEPVVTPPPVEAPVEMVAAPVEAAVAPVEAAAPAPAAFAPVEVPPPGDQTIVIWGNEAPQMQIREEVKETQADGTEVVTVTQRSVPAPHINQSETRVEMWKGFDDPAAVDHTLSTDNDRVLTLVSRVLPDADRKYSVGVHEFDQIVSVHSAGLKPSWVVSNDPEFARVLGEFYHCPVGQPTALLTTVGRDAVHAQHLSGTQPLPFNYMALTAGVGAPAVGDTTLTGEIATAGGGLLRATATYAHTGGTNTSTLTKTFTANGSDTLPVTIAQIGIFNAATVGTLAYHTVPSANATLTVSGDNVTYTWTDTAG